MIDHNTRRVLFHSLLLYFFLALVPGRSQEIALRRSYCDYCSHSYFYYYKSMILVYFFPFFVVLISGRSQVITMREATVTVAGDNILDGL
jgi:hypothetical protein